MYAQKTSEWNGSVIFEPFYQLFFLFFFFVLIIFVWFTQYIVHFVINGQAHREILWFAFRVINLIYLLSSSVHYERVSVITHTRLVQDKKTVSGRLLILFIGRTVSSTSRVTIFLFEKPRVERYWEHSTPRFPGFRDIAFNIENLTSKSVLFQNKCLNLTLTERYIITILFWLDLFINQNTLSTCSSCYRIEFYV